MSEVKSSFAVAPPADPTIYRPMSGLAIASVAIAAIYAVVIAVLGGLSLYYGDPLPLGIFYLVVPAAGVALGLIARYQILSSEGTRSGLALANWGWWLSLLVGLGYGAIYAGTYLALTWQVRNFGTEFFDLLRKGDVNRAFLLTENPEIRAQAQPDNQQYMEMRFGGRSKTPLPGFAQAELTRIVLQGGPETTIRPLGINGWEYDKGHHFIQTYRISTKEGDFDVKMSLRSTEAGKKRAWRVAWSESDINATNSSLTPYGEALRRWRQDSLMFAQIWLQKRAMGIGLDQAYMDTLEPADRNVWKLFHACRRLSDMAAWGSAVTNSGRDALWGLVGMRHDPDLILNSYMPGFAGFSAGSLVDAEKLKAPANYGAEIIQEAKDLFRFTAIITGRATLKISDGNTGAPEAYDASSQRMRIRHGVDFEGTALHSETPETAKFRAEGELILESDPGEFTANRRVEWRVAGLKLVSGGEPPPVDPRQAGRAPAPRPQRAIPQRIVLPNPGEKK